MDGAWIIFNGEIYNDRELAREHLAEVSAARSFCGRMPEEIVTRPMQKFPVGTGSANVLAQIAEHEISDEEFEEREAELFARLRAIKIRQLDLMHEVVHTKDSSSFVIEVGGDEGGFGQRRRPDRRAGSAHSGGSSP